MDIREIQAYAYFVFTALLVALLYGYIIHLYRSEKKGLRDYEKYGKLALDDEIDAPVLEEIPDASDTIKNEKKAKED